MVSSECRVPVNSIPLSILATRAADALPCHKRQYTNVSCGAAGSATKRLTSACSAAVSESLLCGHTCSVTSGAVRRVALLSIAPQHTLVAKGTLETFPLTFRPWKMRTIGRRGKSGYNYAVTQHHTAEERDPQLYSWAHTTEFFMLKLTIFRLVKKFAKVHYRAHNSRLLVHIWQGTFIKPINMHKTLNGKKKANIGRFSPFS